MWPNTVEICITAPLSCSLITAKAIELEKVSLIDMKTLGLLANPLPDDEKYPVLNKDSLTIPIDMELCEK